MKLSREDAAKALSDAPPEKCFWVHNGPILHNVYELSDAVLSMGSDTFRHHASAEKNDFSNWIADVLHDKKLSKDVRGANSKEDVSKRIRKRINELEKICGR